jgi:hypothetical protein
MSDFSVDNMIWLYNAAEARELVKKFSRQLRLAVFPPHASAFNLVLQYRDSKVIFVQPGERFKVCRRVMEQGCNEYRRNLHNEHLQYTRKGLKGHLRRYPVRTIESDLVHIETRMSDELRRNLLRSPDVYVKSTVSKDFFQVLLLVLACGVSCATLATLIMQLFQ